MDKARKTIKECESIDGFAREIWLKSSTRNDPFYVDISSRYHGYDSGRAAANEPPYLYNIRYEFVKKETKNLQLVIGYGEVNLLEDRNELNERSRDCLDTLRARLARKDIDSEREGLRLKVYSYRQRVMDNLDKMAKAQKKMQKKALELA